ncbi:MAG: hypothetical protein U1E17_09030 [Geminicoccaceae bacterium]
MGVVASDAERELDHVEPADIDSTRCHSSLAVRWGRVRAVPAQKLGAALGKLARAVEHVVRQRPPCSGPNSSPRAPGGIGAVGLGQRQLGREAGCFPNSRRPSAPP